MIRLISKAPCHSITKGLVKAMFVVSLAWKLWQHVYQLSFSFGIFFSIECLDGSYRGHGTPIF
jgi:hypothetical protein